MLYNTWCMISAASARLIYFMKKLEICSRAALSRDPNLGLPLHTIYHTNYRCTSSSSVYSIYQVRYKVLGSGTCGLAGRAFYV